MCFLSPDSQALLFFFGLLFNFNRGPDYHRKNLRSTIYIYIYGAYPGAYLVTYVPENLIHTYINLYTAHTLAHTPFFKRTCVTFAALCEQHPLVSRSSGTTSRGLVEPMLFLARASCSDGRNIPCAYPWAVITTCYPLSPGPGCAYGRCLAHTPRRIPIQS